MVCISAAFSRALSNVCLRRISFYSSHDFHGDLKHHTENWTKDMAYVLGLLLKEADEKEAHEKMAAQVQSTEPGPYSSKHDAELLLETHSERVWYGDLETDGLIAHLLDYRDYIVPVGEGHYHEGNFYDKSEYHDRDIPQLFVSFI